VYDAILLPTDGGDGVDAACEYAFDLAARYDATVHALFVADSNRYSTVTFDTGVVDALTEVGAEAVSEIARRGDDREIPVVEEELQGVPHEGIVAYAEEHGIDVIVMATHGREGLDRYLVGSVAERVVRTSPVPVLTIPLAAGATD
jgi:nucleotide-binding universal stress UspA family protein